MYHFHAREYDPFTATWLTRDPYRGTSDDPQSLHRYGYVQGNPVNLWDAYGYAAQSGTYGKEQFPIYDLPNDNLFFQLLKMITGRDLRADLENADSAIEFNPKKLYNFWKHMQTKTLFHRELTPETLREVRALNKKFSFYADYDLEPDIYVSLSSQSVSICAEMSFHAEAGVKIPFNAIVMVDIYGTLGAECTGCFEFSIESGFELDYAIDAYGGIGGRLYAEIDVGIAGARVGGRVEARLQKNFLGGNQDILLYFEAAPFYGYKYWGRDWEDHDLYTATYELPLVDR